ncbi:MAG TPA: D-alanyl-D-alanine carboxypeptidase/D-alanyl-D-alanine-endopeptidase [Blastocatellia bacterium]|nr:D-alanyl-D-alanine carboxypeptidase/D-alanyl-D-alanine-endopeptidase [Blastocatellia bacterium]
MITSIYHVHSCKQPRQFLLLFVLALTLLVPAKAQPSQQTNAQTSVVTSEKIPQSKLEELRAHLTTLVEQPKFAQARLGISIVMPQRSVPVFERDADKLFTPASNMKLYTSAAALDTFGPDFKVKTSVYAEKAVGKNGVLQGNLILYGRGDPNLSARFENDAQGKPNPIDEFTATDRIAAIESLADQLKARGIKTINGGIVGDESYFATERFGASWSWDDLQYYYGAEISALTVNDNAVTFAVKPASRSGFPPIISVQPQTGYLTIINRALTVGPQHPQGNGTRIGVKRDLNSNTVEFFGTIPQRATEYMINIAVHDPASFAATLLHEALVRRGIKVIGKSKRLDALARLSKPFDETKLIELASITSQTLSAMLKVVNKPSQNLHTELLLRQLGVQSKKQNSSEPDLDEYARLKSSESHGLEALKVFLSKAGINPEQLSLRDASGLSRQDLISPRATTQLLTFMLNHPHATVFRDSLPIAGVDGTLDRRMRGTSAENNVRAKTGSLMFVRSLSGYVTTKRGQTLIFSLLGNNYVGAGGELTGLYDQICVLLADFDEEL